MSVPEQEESARKYEDILRNVAALLWDAVKQDYAKARLYHDTERKVAALGSQMNELESGIATLIDYRVRIQEVKQALQLWSYLGLQRSILEKHSGEVNATHAPAYACCCAY